MVYLKWEDKSPYILSDCKITIFFRISQHFIPKICKFTPIFFVCKFLFANFFFFSCIDEKNVIYLHQNSHLITKIHISTMKHFGFSLLLILLLSACSQCAEKPVYVIGVSQCSDDAWRTKMNQEMERELIFHPQMQLHIRQAMDNSEMQCMQIDSFIREGVDLLIVSPNEAEEVKPAVTRAFEAGIPVVVADRRVSGDKWTAFIGGDNVAVGLLMGEWLCGLQDELEEVNVLEICGLPGSTPAVGRHAGMMERIRDCKHVHIVGSGMASWFRGDAEIVTDSLLLLYPEANVIVAQNDQMAQGASQAARKAGRQLKIMGVDGISGEGGGIDAIVEGRIDVSATYPSRGDMVIQTAAKILAGEPFVRDTVLQTALIDAQSAKPIMLQADIMDHEIETFYALQNKMLHLGDEYEMQRIIIYGLVMLVGLIVMITLILFQVYEYRQRVKKEREINEAKLAKQQHQLEKITAELALSRAQQQHFSEEHFMQRLEEQIDLRLSDPMLDVEKLAVEMGMSRTGLYRKVKAATGQSPVELIRHIRLHKAQQLLRSTDATVQQVAYEVGFSAANYFAKCYKEEFGVSPTEDCKKSQPRTPNA